MSACYTAPYTIPAATLGPENPLPDIKNVSYIHAEIEATTSVPPELTLIPCCRIHSRITMTETACFVLLRLSFWKMNT